MAKILVVDDRPSIVDVLRMLLEMQNYTVLTCGDGAEVLDLTRSGRPDVIVLDLILPGKNGIKVLQELKDDPDLAEIPVIAMTARNEKAAEAEPLAHSCIMKPFDITDVLQLVETALGDRLQVQMAK